MARKTKHRGRREPGLADRVTGLISRTGGRGAAGGGLAAKATGFVRGFLSGGEAKRGRRRR